LEVSKSGYGAWKNRPKSRRSLSNDLLLIEIRRVFVDNKEDYGSPRIYKALREKNIVCSENRIARLMRLNGRMSPFDYEKRSFPSLLTVR